MKSFLIWVSVVGVTLLSGCATKYSCGQFPDAECSPVSKTYDETNSGYYDYRTGLFVDKKKKREAMKDEQKAKYDDYSGHKNRLSFAQSGDPILTKPLYLRLSFNDWVDVDNDLHSGGYVYVKTQESEWITTEK